AYSSTKVSGLQVPTVIDGDATLQMCRTLGGNGFLVSDELVFRLQAEMARMEGIYCEPAGAVALAGAIQAAEEGLFNPGEQVICLVTGHGFKDKDMYQRTMPNRHRYFDGIKDVEEYINQTFRHS